MDAPLRVEKIAQFLGLESYGDDRDITCFTPFNNRQPGSFSFLSSELSETFQASGQNCTVITTSVNLETLVSYGFTVIVSLHPKYHFAKAVNGLAFQKPEPYIHPSAYIGPDVTLGERVSIGPGSVLTGKISVGDDCCLAGNVCLSNDVSLGVGVYIRNGTVIGEDAFSFGFGPENLTERFPCFGGVRIGDGAEFGNNAIVSRGVFGDTVIGRNARINDLAHIGNTVTIGDNTLVMAHTDISARVSIGKGCWIAQSAAIRQGIAIGDNVTVGMGAVVTKDVGDGLTVYGVPATSR